MLAGVMVLGCGDDTNVGPDAGTPDLLRRDGALPDVPDASQPDSAPDSGPPPPTGFIGSPCKTVQDCQYPSAECLTDGFPGGTCSQACAQYCPDRDGHPMTFCVDTKDLPPAAAALGAGACFSRCDFAIYHQTGCRQGYVCVRAHRANASTETFVCLPGQTSDLSSCHLDLAADGLGFEPTVLVDAHPAPPNDNLTCTVQDPVYLFSPVRGVKITLSGKETKRLLVACTAAKAIAATVDDLKAHGAASIDSMGTYNCRVIAGTTTLSRHAFGDAFDIAGVTLGDGTSYTLLDDWEHDTSTPQTKGGQFLYQAAYRWYNASIWNIILTPNYNVDHDNHFHVDLTPGSHLIKLREGQLFFGPYFGPAPYAD